MKQNELFNSIEAIFSRVYKHPLNSEALERLRVEVQKLSDAIRQEADIIALERVAKLNEAIKVALNEKLGKYLEDHEERIARIEARYIEIC